MNLKMQSLIIKHLRISRFMGALRAKMPGKSCSCSQAGSPVDCGLPALPYRRTPFCEAPDKVTDKVFDKVEDKVEDQVGD